MKYFQIVLFFAFGVANCLAQKNAVKFQVGSGMPLESSLIGQNIYVNNSTSTYNGVYGSYGSGFTLEGGYIYSISRAFSAELDATYLRGSEINYDYISSATSSNSHNSSYARFGQISFLARTSFGERKVKPFLAVGIILGFGKIFYKGTTVNPTGTSFYQESEARGSQSLGAKALVGAEFTHGKLSYFAQVGVIGMNYAPSEFELTKYLVNGADELNSVPVSQRKIQFQNSITVVNGGNPNQPAQEIKTYVPFNNVSLNLGMLYRF